MIRNLRRIYSRRNHSRWIQLERVLGIRIYDFSLFEKALRHPSVERNQNPVTSQSYERLEFLGDAILGWVIAEYLYDKFPEKMEGFLTSTRSKLVSGKACAGVARDLGIGEFVELDPHTESQGGRTNNSILGDCLESIIGAIHLDRGITISRRFIHRHILEQVDLARLIAKDENYKSRLQEFVQAKGWPQPNYLHVGTDGPPHDLIFTMEVYVGECCHGRGQATSKKKAEQLAARQALKSFSKSDESIP